MKRTASFVMFLLSTSAAAYAQVDQCVNRRIAKLEERRPISQTGGVTCGSADVVGFPPRERKHDAHGQVCLTAPEGHILVNENIQSIAVIDNSNNGGGRGSPSVNGDRQACVPVWCRGAGLGQGRRWIDITISGQTKKTLSQETIVQIAIACARDPNSFPD